jgi:hypothetical protein
LDSTTDPIAFYNSFREAFPNATPDNFAIFPVGDTEISLVNAQRSLFERSCLVVAVEPRLCELFANKDASVGMVCSLGIRVPQSFLVRAALWREDLVRLRNESWSRRELTLKRPSSKTLLFGQKAIFCRSFAELERVVSNLHREQGAGGDVLVQERLSGTRRNCRFVALRGRLLTYFEQEVLRTDRLDGSGYGIEGRSVAPSRLQETVEKLAAALNYTGVGLMQFMTESNGDAGFLELNTRLDGSCAIAYSLGCNLPLLALQAHQALRFGGTPPERSPKYDNYRHGTRYHWLAGDIQGLFHEIRDNHLQALGAAKWICSTLRSVATAHSHLTFDLGDPAPALHLHYTMWKNFVAKLRRQSDTTTVRRKAAGKRA